MMIAIAFIYVLDTGGRHLISFIIAGFIIIGMYSARIADKVIQAILIAATSFFFLYQPDTPYTRLVPFYEEQLAEDINSMHEILQEKMTYTPGITWENTVIWLSDDIVNGKAFTETAWQQLYALPSGFGINYCTQNYVMEHMNTLKAGYIAVIPGGEVEKKLLETNALLMGENESIAIYRIA